MPVYLIADIQVHDPQRYAQYTEQAQEIVVQHGGRYLIRGGSVTPLSGNWQPERILVIAFDTIEQLRACFASPEYRAIAPLREDSTTSRSIIVTDSRLLPLPAQQRRAPLDVVAAGGVSGSGRSILGDDRIAGRVEDWKSGRLKDNMPAFHSSKNWRKKR